MAQQNSYIINGQLTFNGSLTGQAAVAAQSIGGNLLFLLPNELPIANQVVTAIAVSGNTVTLGFTNPGPQSFSFSQITGTISTGQLGSTEGNGGKVQLTTGAAVSPVTSKLGTAAEYAILAYSGITNTGASVVTGGNIGSAPTPGPQSGFTFTAPAAIDNSNAGAARTAGNAAFAYYSALTPTQTGLANLSTNNGGGGVGVYQAGVFSGGALDIPTSITLDAQGNPGALFVFISASTTILESGASILLINGAQAANVVWCVGSSFTQIGNNNTMVGTILAYTSITLDGGTLNGRALAVGGNGAVTIAAAEAITATEGTGSVTAGDVVIYDAYGNVVDSGILLSSLGGAAGVTSFNGRSGAVSPTSGDYSVAQVTGAAPLASPTFTGVPAAPTAAPLTNSTQIATTAYADAAVAVEVAARTTAVSAAITTAETFATTADTTVLSTAEAFATAADAAYAPLAGAAFTGPVSITFGGVGLTVNAELNMGNNQTLLMGANGHLFMSSSSLNDGTSSPGANGQPLTSTITGVAWSNSVSAASGQDFVINSTGTNKVRINTGANVFDFFGSTGGMNLGAQNASIAISVAGVISLSSAPSTKISLAPGTVVNISGVPGPYANNAAATGAGLTAGDVYYTAADPRTLAVVF